MNAFEWATPATVDEAVKLLAEVQADAQQRDFYGPGDVGIDHRGDFISGRCAKCCIHLNSSLYSVDRQGIYAAIHCDCHVQRWQYTKCNQHGFLEFYEYHSGIDQFDRPRSRCRS